MATVARKHRNRINELCDEKGISLRKVALLSGVSYNFLWEVAHGRKQPTVGMAHKIARVFERTVDDVFPDTESARTA